MSRPSTVIIGVLLVSLVILVFAGMANVGVDNYNQTIDGNYSSYFSDVNSTVSEENTRINNIQDKVQSSDSPIEAAGIVITGGLWSGLMLFFGALGSAVTLVSSTVSTVIPGGGGIIVTILLAIMTIVVVALIAGRIFGRDL